MFQAYGLPTPIPCRRPDRLALERLSKSEAHYCVPTHQDFWQTPNPQTVLDILPPNCHRQNASPKAKCLTRRRPNILHNGLPYFEATQPKILTDPPQGRTHSKQTLAPWQHTYWARSSYFHGVVGGCMRGIWSEVEISGFLSLMNLFSGVMMACYHFRRCLFCC